jgi:hypothetical protein
MPLAKILSIVYNLMSAFISFDAAKRGASMPRALLLRRVSRLGGSALLMHTFSTLDSR